MKEMLRMMKTIARQPNLALKALALSTLLAFAANAVHAAKEITYPAGDFTKLDTFEGLSIEDADKFFGKQDYKSAFAEYQAYSEQFPKGKALPYAVLRMGRCKHLMKKRGEAIRFYEEVVDYFPNDVRYAAGALFYLGLAHRDNGDEKKCLATWARMVKDKAYVKEVNSGEALNYLAHFNENDTNRKRQHALLNTQKEKRTTMSGPNSVTASLKKQMHNKSSSKTHQNGRI